MNLGLIRLIVSATTAYIVAFASHTGAATLGAPLPHGARAESLLTVWETHAQRVDSARVDRLEPRPVEPAEGAVPRRELRRGYFAMVDREWIARFTALVRSHVPYFPDQRCAPREGGDVYGVRFGGCDTCASVLVAAADHCMQLSIGRQPMGSATFGEAGDSLMALVHEAMRGDSVPISPRTRAAIIAPRTALGDMPKPGEYVFVEDLPEALTKVAPVYPDAARGKGVDGTVLVQALVGKDGHVKDAFIVHSIPLLDDAALAAVRQWVFKPARAKGAPVAVWVAVPIRFTLH